MSGLQQKIKSRKSGEETNRDSGYLAWRRRVAEPLKEEGVPASAAPVVGPVSGAGEDLLREEAPLWTGAAEPLDPALEVVPDRVRWRPAEGDPGDAGLGPAGPRRGEVRSEEEPWRGSVLSGWLGCVLDGRRDVVGGRSGNDGGNGGGRVFISRGPELETDRGTCSVSCQGFQVYTLKVFS